MTSSKIGAPHEVCDPSILATGAISEYSGHCGKNSGVAPVASPRTGTARWHTDSLEPLGLLERRVWRRKNCLRWFFNGGKLPPKARPKALPKAFPKLAQSSRVLSRGASRSSNIRRVSLLQNVSAAATLRTALVCPESCYNRRCTRAQKLSRERSVTRRLAEPSGVRPLCHALSETFREDGAPRDVHPSPAHVPSRRLRQCAEEPSGGTLWRFQRCGAPRSCPSAPPRALDDGPRSWRRRCSPRIAVADARV